MSVIAMSNKIPKRPKITYHVNYLESRRKAKAHDKKYEEPKSFPSKPLKPYVDFAAPAGQTLKKDSILVNRPGNRRLVAGGKSRKRVDSEEHYFGKGMSAKMKQSQHLLQQYKDKRKSIDHRKKGPR